MNDFLDAKKQKKTLTYTCQLLWRFCTDVKKSIDQTLSGIYETLLMTFLSRQTSCFLL